MIKQFAWSEILCRTMACFHVIYISLISGGDDHCAHYLHYSVRRALAAKLRGPGFKSRPGTVGGPVTIIMWGARPGWKLAFS